MKKESRLPIRIENSLKEEALQKAFSLQLSLSMYIRFLISKDLGK